jgi:hypothetical protein
MRAMTIGLLLAASLHVSMAGHTPPVPVPVSVSVPVSLSVSVPVPAPLRAPGPASVIARTPQTPAATQTPPTPTPSAQTPPAQAAPSQADLPTIRLEVRVFDGGDDVTHQTKVKLYQKGQRSSDIPMTAATSPGQPTTAMVPVGFYDAQAIRERARGEAPNIHWALQWLVQRYPDEYGRHLEVINFKPGYGALQVRPAPSEAAAAKGWSGIAYAAGDATKELAKSTPSGDDLLFALPSGRYDIKVTLADKSTQWIRDIDVPADRTRLKTWSYASSSR